MGAEKMRSTMADPAKAAEAEAKMEHMVKTGEEGLKKGAMNAMEEAMKAMSNPDVMSQMGKMLKDPKFLEQVTAMTKDPQFKPYMDAMKEMSKDPSQKEKLQKMSEAFRSAL